MRLFVALLLHLVAYVAPQSCSCGGRGKCTPYLVCECDEGWRGPSCALRACPSGLAWVGYGGGGLDDVHTLSSECSGVGPCNTRTGKCVCNAGFSGDACQTLACPTAGNLVCGGKGKCMSLAAAAAAGNSAGSASLPRPASQYRAWDAERVFGCVCDEGWSGPDCTVQLCPQGPDPLTTALPEVQSVTCTCGEGGDCSSGGFSVSYGPRTALVLAAARATTAEEDPTAPQGSGYALGESVESVLRSVAPGMISTVVLTGGAASACGPSPGATLVTFLPSLGNVPPLLLGQGTLPHPDSVQLTLSTFQDGTAEVLPCSGRGKCTGGACTCLPGFYPSDGAGGPGAVANCGSLYPPPALGPRPRQKWPAFWRI
jgi:hypothetical protein